MRTAQSNDDHYHTFRVLTLHPLLTRQIAKTIGSTTGIDDRWTRLLQVVSDSYTDNDADQATLERSMDLVSAEMVDRFGQLQKAMADSQKSQRELEHVLAVLVATLESSADGLLVVGAEGGIEHTNRRLAEIWGFNISDVPGATDSALFELMAERIAEPGPFLQLSRMPHRDVEGDTFDLVRLSDGRTVERHSTPRRMEGGVVGRVWQFRDVTGRLALEEQLRQSQKMDAVGQLAGGIAHDFNNLLTVIGVHGELLRDAFAVGTDERDGASEIVQAADSAAALTRQLLAFSRKQMLQLVDLDLNTVASDIEPMLRRLIGEQCEYASVFAGSPAIVRADRGQIQQVLLNLVVNARDAMPRGGTISVEIAKVVLPDSSDLVRDDRAEAGLGVMLSVSDAGPGVPKAVRDRIFEPFFTTKAVGKGTGLGLATVYGIVRQIGGRIWVDDTTVEGATFRAWFPACAALAASGEWLVGTPELLAGTETVLLVEDERAVRDLASQVLRGHGYEVLTARHGVDAIRIAAESSARIDLLITDLVMPELGGQELVSFLRRDRPELPVIYMSGYTDRPMDSSGPDAVCTAFLQKPFTSAGLPASVRSLLDRVKGFVPAVA